jgi:hypothetical protein
MLSMRPMLRSVRLRALFVPASVVAIAYALAACGGKIAGDPTGDGTGGAAKGTPSSDPIDATSASDVSEPPPATCAAAPALGPGCVRRMQGGHDSTSCKPDAKWRGYAADDCAQQGLWLEEARTCDPCGDSFETVEYTCCPASAQPGFDPEDAGPEIDATPPGCHEEAAGTNGCSTFEQMTALSEQRCANQGLSLGLVEVHQKCATGGWTQVFYTCCAVK